MKLNQFINYFVPKKYLNDVELNRKSKFIIWLVFILILITVFFSVLIYFQNSQNKENSLAAVIIAPLLITGLFIFRKTGSFVFFTHFFCGIFFIGMGLMPNTTGGIFSPDMPTFYILPVFALIMGSQRIGLFYGILTALVFVAYYIFGIQYHDFYFQQSAVLPADYFFFNILLNFAVLLFLVFRNEGLRLKLLSELKETNNIISHKQKEITDSINYAQRLQYAILPPKEFISKHLPETFILYKPKDIVAGDFYWAESIGDLFFIAAADSTGHGVPGAMVSVVCSGALNRTVKEFGFTDTGKILDKTRELVVETFSKSNTDVKDGMDISLLCIDKQNQKIFWSGANNPLWYASSASAHQLSDKGNLQKGNLSPDVAEVNEMVAEALEATINEIKANKQPIGKTDNPKPFTTQEIEYKENTTFYLFTDGLADQFGGPKGKKFKYKQFEQLLVSINDKPMQEQSSIIDKAFEEWKGPHEQVDDVCVIGIKI